MERREGKQPMIYSENNESSITKRKKSQPNGLRLAEPTRYDPSYQGPPPPSLQFLSRDDSFALLPHPNVAATTIQVNTIREVAMEIQSNVSKAAISQRARRRREKEHALSKTIPQSDTSFIPHALAVHSSISPSPCPSPLLTSIPRSCEVSRSALNTLSNATIAQRARRQREKELAQSKTISYTNTSYSPTVPDQDPFSPSPSPLLNSNHQSCEVSTNIPTTLRKCVIAQRARRQREKELAQSNTGPLSKLSQEGSHPQESSVTRSCEGSLETNRNVSKFTLAQRLRRQRERMLAL